MQQDEKIKRDIIHRHGIAHWLNVLMLKPSNETDFLKLVDILSIALREHHHHGAILIFEPAVLGYVNGRKGRKDQPLLRFKVWAEWLSLSTSVMLQGSKKEGIMLTESMWELLEWAESELTRSEEEEELLKTYQKVVSILFERGLNERTFNKLCARAINLRLEKACYLVKTSIPFCQG